jgi:DHA1 family bicyclomycin/chloramphenicol resistance-like MFS transporter
VTANALPRTAARGPFLIVILGAVTALGALSMDTYLPAFPAIAADLGVPAGQVQLSLTSCLLGIALGQLVSGPLSDRWGRRRPAVVGIAAYGIVSLLIALSPSAPVLIGLRFLQGFAGGTGVVVARAIVRDLYSGAAAARFFSQLILIFGLAPVLAPSIGGLVLRITSWHGIFVALGLFGILLTAVVAIWLPETLPAERRGAGGGGTLGMAGPLFGDRAFLGYAAAQALAFAAMFTYLGGSPFVLQNGFGLSPSVYAVVFGVNALGFTLLSQANVRLLARVGPRRLLFAALAVQVAFGVVVLAAALLGSLAGLLVGLFLAVGAIGMIQPNATALALDRHPDRAGTAAALLGFAQSGAAAAAAPLSGIGAPGRGVPMAALMVGFAAAALATVLATRRAT